MAQGHHNKRLSKRLKIATKAPGTNFINSVTDIRKRLIEETWRYSRRLDTSEKGFLVGRKTKGNNPKLLDLTPSNRVCANAFLAFTSSLRPQGPLQRELLL